MDYLGVSFSESGIRPAKDRGKALEVGRYGLHEEIELADDPRPFDSVHPFWSEDSGSVDEV